MPPKKPISLQNQKGYLNSWSCQGSHYIHRKPDSRSEGIPDQDRTRDNRDEEENPDWENWDLVLKKFLSS